MSTKDLSKDDASPVTVADFAAQALIVGYLSKLFPEDKFIAEEDSNVSELVLLLHRTERAKPASAAKRPNINSSR